MRCARAACAYGTMPAPSSAASTNRRRHSCSRRPDCRRRRRASSKDATAPWPTPAPSAHPLVVKPLFGSQGNGIMRAATPDDLPAAEAVGDRSTTCRTTARARGHGLRGLARVRLQRAHPRRHEARRQNLDHQRASGRRARARTSPIAEMQSLALAAVRAIGADYAGVDLIRDARRASSWCSRSTPTPPGMACKRSPTSTSPRRLAEDFLAALPTAGSTMTTALPRAVIAEAFVAACKAELRALKPGNVHIYAAGHRMQVKRLRNSAPRPRPRISPTRASESAPASVAPSMPPWMPSAATRTSASYCSAAPLAAAARNELAVQLCSAALSAVLAGLDRKDAAEAFAAISRANPAGLGRPRGRCRRQPAGVTLLEAMALAARRDRIARAYVTGFADIFDSACRGWPRPARAGARPRTPSRPAHGLSRRISRQPHRAKARRAAARSVKDVAPEPSRRLCPGRQSARPPAPHCLEFDRELKAEGLNPGTTADFVVATLFAETIISRRTALRGAIAPCRKYSTGAI